MLLCEAEKLANERDECFHQLVQYAKIKKLVQDYINRNHISCSESIYQMDRPQVEAIDLVAELCRIVGWYGERRMQEEASE